ncbi:tRNA uridine-5-carboxymethylaminomethyl(34) synthesis GTPase MnmE [Sphingomonas bacterium]|uniref:tRNA uridine-5-carboxymethylaminomethyl(34) synthesis GTPase MnmE n=1 Tax=Sphingomonas bacterium TaxID=1895847 RepID=UPI0020C6ABC4|nr:tRNA uridine-5-carboxymethylaminomethyl(34) synthesis GTPase MnmE [Sphingomonas bacterium]
MSADAGETIFALSSGALPAAIAILRVSGPAAGGVLRALAGRLPEPRRATLASLRDRDGALLDRALLLWFPGPGSATGEDLAELHVHGGKAVVRAVLAAIGGVRGCRMAEPGEFTRRALRNGRLDFTGAEGLADLLAAETEQARRAALLMAEGGLSRRIHGWRERLLALTAEIEAALEFGEALEEEELLPEAFGAALNDLRADIAAAVQAPPAERLRDGFRVVIAGPPNSGKSTLINALAERNVAIATPVAGTTRDALEAPVMLGGTALLLTDTAGLRESDDAVEAIGIDRARAAIAAADLVIWLGAAEVAAQDWLSVHSRNDLAERRITPPGYALGISAMTGEGLDDLRARILTAARSASTTDDLALNQRQRLLLAEAATALSDAATQHDPVLCAEQLRTTCGYFDAVAGGTDVEAVLDGLFARFCLGK